MLTVSWSEIPEMHAQLEAHLFLQLRIELVKNEVFVLFGRFVGNKRIIFFAIYNGKYFTRKHEFMISLLLKVFMITSTRT